MQDIRRSASVSTALPQAPRGTRRSAARCDRRSSRNSLRAFCHGIGWNEENERAVDDEPLPRLPGNWFRKPGDDGTGAPAYA